jgi:cytochrome c oxidase subunit 3
MVGAIKLFTFSNSSLFFWSFFILGLVIIGWWRDVIRESSFQGEHRRSAMSGLVLGILLFIVREVLFFFSFFWAFFHSRLNPVLELGGVWPPLGVTPLNAFQVPLLNTVILLASGIRITWAHQSILSIDWQAGRISLMFTWGIGIYFLLLQGIEYSIAIFGIRDSIYGSTFFIATGFHGLHVIVGTLFLIAMWGRLRKRHFRNSHHFGFECAAWYWHFVDVVWLFLFSVIYWWGTLL